MCYRAEFGCSRSNRIIITSCAGGRQNMPRPCDLDLLTLKVVSESHVTWATSMPILVFLGLSVLDLGLTYATDRQTDRCQMRIIAWCPRYGGEGVIIYVRSIGNCRVRAGSEIWVAFYINLLTSRKRRGGFRSIRSYIPTGRFGDIR